MWTMDFILVCLVGLASVAFLTLLERKLLGLSQNRLGPNKVSLTGLIQPLADGMKLIFKEFLFTKLSTSLLFFFSPLLMFLIFLIIWGLVLPWGEAKQVKFISFLFFCLLGVSAYTIIFTGWSSTSGFSKLGSLRGMLQSLSFEVTLFLIFMSVLASSMSFFFSFEEKLSLEVFIIYYTIWILFSLMETNRAPFDLLEGESELISGFNIEISSLLFIFLFLSEYGMIIVMSCLGSMTMTGKPSIILLVIGLITMLFCRSCYPRIRYDILMSLMWKSLLPICLGWFLMMIVLV